MLMARFEVKFRRHHAFEPHSLSAVAESLGAIGAE